MILYSFFGGISVSFTWCCQSSLPFMFLFYVQCFKYSLYLKILKYHNSVTEYSGLFSGTVLIFCNKMYKVLSV